MDVRRRGFTLVELMVVVLVLAVLAGIGLLKYVDLRATARTASLAGDVRAIQMAAVNYFADFEQWPPEAAPGAVPTGLTGYLPGDLASSLDRQVYVLDFQNLVIGGEPLIGVAVTSTDARLVAKFIATFGSRAPYFLNGGTLTYLIAGPGGFF